MIKTNKDIYHGTKTKIENNKINTSINNMLFCAICTECICEKV